MRTQTTGADAFKVGDHVWFVESETSGAREGFITFTDGEKDGRDILDVQVKTGHQTWGYPEQFTHFSPMA